MILNLPIVLTLFRVILIPVFLVAFFAQTEHANLIAMAIFMVAGATDFLDGYLARKWNQVTNFGSFLDPVADKLMVTVAMIAVMVSYQDVVLTVLGIVMISRELVISALREWMAQLGKRDAVAVSQLGKYKTSVQMFAITALLFQYNEAVIQIGFYAYYLATLLTVWSMVEYLRQGWKFIK